MDKYEASVASFRQLLETMTADELLRLHEKHKSESSVSLPNFFGWVNSDYVAFQSPPEYLPFAIMKGFTSGFSSDFTANDNSFTEAA